MIVQRFRLVARVSSANPAAVRGPLVAFAGADARVAPVADGFQVEAEIEGEDARTLNRTLLTELRRVEKRTRLRSEWTADGVTERFFDYVPKGKRPASPTG
jgi:hypothetical protein